MAGRLERALWRLKNPGVLARARQHSQQILRETPVRRLLVLCYGNIYRSPFSAALLKSVLPDTVNVSSAGFHPKADRAVPLSFLTLANEYGIELEQHRSALASPDLLQQADIVVIMDRWNWSSIKRVCPHCLGKTIWLGAQDGEGNVEIDDPYGKEASTVSEIARQLYDSTQRLVDRLIVTGR